MIIEWIPERLLAASITRTEKEKKKTREGIVLDLPSSITIQPGCNNVLTNIWNRIQKSVDIHVKQGNIIVHNVLKTKDGLTQEIPFHKLDESKTDEIISKTHSLQSLDVWLEKEKRKEVRFSLRKRKESIEDKIKNRKGNK